MKRKDEGDLTPGGECISGPGERFNNNMSMYINGYRNGRLDVKEILIQKIKDDTSISDEEAFRMVGIINDVIK